jgi:hypothetical protein
MAFKTAEEKLGICKLLDPEDVYTENGIPDGKELLLTVFLFHFHNFQL